MLVVSEVFPPAVGGSGELMHNVYARFGDVPVTVLTVGDQGDHTRELGGIVVVTQSVRARRWGLLHPSGLARHLGRARVQRRLVGRQPTVTHCNSVLPDGLDARLASAIGAGPYLTWAHGEELATASGSRELTWLARHVFQRSSAVIANTAHTASWVERFGADRDRLHVVHPGVDAARFAPTATSGHERRRSLAPRGEHILLTVGRLQRRKGHDTMLAALARWPATAPAVRYVIVGDGDERRGLERQVRELRLNDRVAFAGAVPAEDLPSYYAAADLFVHPNRLDGSDFEGFGIVFLEAAAAGLAVVGGRTGGVPEAVMDGVTGVLVSGTSADELIEVLVALLNDPDRRRALGAAGRARATREFTWERAAAAVAAIHQDVAAREFRGTP